MSMHNTTSNIMVLVLLISAPTMLYGLVTENHPLAFGGALAPLALSAICMWRLTRAFQAPALQSPTLHHGFLRGLEQGMSKPALTATRPTI